MMFLDYGIPLIALALGGCGILAAREMSRRFDRQMAKAAQRKHHPAE